MTDTHRRISTLGILHQFEHRRTGCAMERGGEEVPRTVSETKTERYRGCGRFQLVRDDTVCNASQRENGRHNIRPVEWNKAPHVAIKTASEDVLVSMRTSVIVYRMILCSFWWIFCAERKQY